MDKISKYDAEQLSPEDIRTKRHREFVGGMWEEMGRHQFDYLVAEGLQRRHKLLDVGCGSLRGGLHFIDYLDAGNYFGIDINQSLIDAAHLELKEAGLTGKRPVLMVDDRFDFSEFGEQFDFMLSVSVFTHLPLNNIVRCLKNASTCLSVGGAYYATFFEAPFDAHLDDIRHAPGGILTHYDSNPFHYSTGEIGIMAGLAGLQVSIPGEWGHPRNQRMALFKK